MASEMQLFEAALYPEHAVNQKQLYFYDFLTNKKQNKPETSLHQHVNELECIDINIPVNVVLTALRVICSLTHVAGWLHSCCEYKVAFLH